MARFFFSLKCFSQSLSFKLRDGKIPTLSTEVHILDFL